MPQLAESVVEDSIVIERKPPHVPEQDPPGFLGVVSTRGSLDAPLHVKHDGRGRLSRITPRSRVHPYEAERPSSQSGFLQEFPDHGLLYGLSQLHEPARQSPVPSERRVASAH